MAKGASDCLFLLLFCVLTVCSSGTLVGFSYDARRKTAASSPLETISFLTLNKVSPTQIRVFVADQRVLKSLSNTGVFVDLYLNQTQVANLIKSKPATVSWLKTHLMIFLPYVNIESIIVSSSSSSNDLPGQNGLSQLLFTLKSIHSILHSFRLDRQVKVSAAFSLSVLENLDRKHERDLHRIFNFINKCGSFVIVEDSIDGELSMGDRFVQSMIKRATSATSILHHSNVSMVLTIKSSAVPSAIEVAEFSNKISRSFKNNKSIIGKISGLFAEVSPIKEFEQKELEREEEQMFPSSHRGLLNNFHFKETLHDEINPPTTVFPTTPITNPSTAPPVTIPPYNPTPTIVTVPGSNPVSTPVTVPSTTPIPTPPTNPVNSPVPVTNPVTTPITVPGAQPITNPVTTYPAPSGGIPVTTPVTNPVAPPATTNPPVVSGQSWCVVKTGASETAVQAALDYACGIGGADCSLIQQGGSCYNPNTLQNHASYAFNSYYQKNPVASSCDFGGAAMIVNTNPSTGSCIYPSSSSSSTPASSTPIPTSTTPTTPTSSGTAAPVYGSPPTVLNSSNPASATTTVFGSDSPPAVNTSTSISAGLQPFVGCIFLLTSFVTGKIVLDM